MLVLVSRPTPAGVDERSLRALTAAVTRRTGSPTRIAHLDQADPSIHGTFDAAVSDGAETVLLVPLAIPADRYLVTWIGKTAAPAAPATERARPTAPSPTRRRAPPCRSPRSAASARATSARS